MELTTAEQELNKPESTECAQHSVFAASSSFEASVASVSFCERLLAYPASDRLGEPQIERQLVHSKVYSSCQF